MLTDCDMHKERAKLNCPETFGFCGGSPGNMLTDCTVCAQNGPN